MLNLDNRSQLIQTELNKLIGNSGIIHLQTEVDLIINIREYVRIGVSQEYDDGEPMIYELIFINESQREDKIEFWEDSIMRIDYDPLSNDVDAKLLFSFIYDEDSEKYIEFYVK